ncbi:MAG: hypothetical protein V3573_00265 [Desulfovibrionaceae bacterium]
MSALHILLLLAFWGILLLEKYYIVKHGEKSYIYTSFSKIIFNKKERRIHEIFFIILVSLAIIFDIEISIVILFISVYTAQLAYNIIRYHMRLAKEKKEALSSGATSETGETETPIGSGRSD